MMDTVIDVCGTLTLGYVVFVFASTLLTFLYRKFVCAKRFAVKDKHVVITGGSTGIGLSIAKECVRRGARVTLMARSEDKLVKACQEINAKRVNAQYACADVTSRESLEKAFEKASAFGPIDVLVTSAGSAKPGYFLEQDMSVFERSIKLNYLGTVNAAKLAASRMTERRSGHMIFVASAAAVVSFLGYSSYAPTKYALRGFADSLRNELRGFGVRISIAYPPDTDTPGFKKENETKPKETLAISPPTVYSSVVVAQNIVDGMEMGDYHLGSPDLVQNLLVSAMSGVSPRAYPMLELAISPLLGFLQLGFMFYADYIANGYGSSRSKSSSGSSMKKKVDDEDSKGHGKAE
jgi:3-dehydrosphinganine reductase